MHLNSMLRTSLFCHFSTNLPEPGRTPKVCRCFGSSRIRPIAGGPLFRLRLIHLMKATPQRKPGRIPQQLWRTTPADPHQQNPCGDSAELEFRVDMDSVIIQRTNYNDTTLWGYAFPNLISYYFKPSSSYNNTAYWGGGRSLIFPACHLHWLAITQDFFLFFSQILPVLEPSVAPQLSRDGAPCNWLLFKAQNFFLEIFRSSAFRCPQWNLHRIQGLYGSVTAISR